MRKGLFTKLLGFFLILYCVIIIIGIIGHQNIYQLDFCVYYYSAKAQGLGLNPYDTGAIISQIAGAPMAPYLYSPFSLYFFQLFTKLDYNLALILFLIFKLMLMTGLICLWRNKFLDKKTDMFFYLLCLFAFNSTIYLDLRAGNISLIEQFMIWLAFFCYLKRKFICFCILILAASIFKIQPILFLFLLLFSEEKKRYQYLIGAFAAFGITLLLQFVSSPELFSNFIANTFSAASEGGGIINPSTFTFIRDLCQKFLRIPNAPLLNEIALAIHLVVASIIICVSWTAFIRIKFLKGEDKNRWIVFLACLCYALINIRFKDYSYIVLILPTYFIIKTIRISPKGLLLFVVSVSVASMPLPGTPVIYQLFWDYYPLLTAYLVWLLYLHELHRKIEEEKFAA